jgi:hypothetical protein
MKPMSDPQELARRFNEDEAVWRRMDEKPQRRDPASPILMNSWTKSIGTKPSRRFVSPDVLGSELREARSAAI